MSNVVPFTDNYQDLSTDQGFQFRFHCERCGNGYLSSFQPNVTGLAGEAIRAAGGLLGGLLGRASESSYDIQRMIAGPAHDAALRKAVGEVSPRFIQCRHCGQWVCREVCWNTQRNQCVTCAPKMDEEIAAIESQATIQQLRQKSMDGSVDLTGGVNLQSAASGAVPVSAETECTECGMSMTAGAKFCPECGAKAQKRKFCPACGVEVLGETKFCSECGTRLS